MSHTAWPILVLGKMLAPPALRAEVEVRTRALAAICLYRIQQSPILTFEAPLQNEPCSGSTLVVDTLREGGVPMSSIVQRQDSTSTAEELELATDWLAQHNFKGLRVVSARYHLPRVARKVRRFPWPSVLYSPEMIAFMDSGNSMLFEGRTRPEVYRIERRFERRWALADGIASCLPNVFHQRIEILAGRWWRRKLI